MNIFICSFLLFVLSSQILADEKIRYDNFKVHRIVPKTKEAVESLRILSETPSGYDFWTGVRGVGVPVHVMVPPHYKYRFNDFIKSSNFDSIEFISNVQELIDGERNRTRVDASFGWTDYHTLDEINAWLQDLAKNNPDTVTLVNGGTSYEGRDIWGVHISFSPANKQRAVFLEGNIHAREWISSAVTTWILNAILTSTDPDIRQIAENHDWYIFPVFNPDGFAYTHSTDRMWRKTRVPYFLCYGADPNRNWDFHFNDGGCSSFACSETYCGPESFSEPSTKSLSQYISTIGQNLRAYISLHSFSQLMLIPYGYTNAHLENYQDLYSIGLKGAASLAKRYNTEYTVGNIVDVLYVASGSTTDWVKGNFGTPITYDYELRDTGRYGFVLPADQIIPCAEETLDSLVTILQEFDKILPYDKNN